MTGVSGQLGSEILKISDHDNFGFYFNNKPKSSNGTFIKCDVTDRNKIFESIMRVKPDWILHLASATKVEWCESNKGLAWKINVDGTRNIVDACNRSDSNLIFVSSDFVFDGKQGNYKENDTRNPINFYGKTKLEGEELVERYPSHVITRSCLMYSSKQGTFTSWVLEGLKRGGVNAALDIITSPTLASELASCLLFIVKKGLRGVYHTAGDEAVSKYEFVGKFAETFGYSSDLVKPVKQEDLGMKALRPKNSSLDISRIKSAGFTFSKLNVALKKLREELKEQD